MKKKTFVTTLLAVTAALLCVFCLISCGNKHVHEYDSYRYNNDATCVKKGTETAKCKHCEKTVTRNSKDHPATGIHYYGEYNYNNDATCAKAGTETAKCKNCPDTVTQVSEDHPATGAHDYEDYVCKVCLRYSPSAPITDGLDFREYYTGGKLTEYLVSGIGSVVDSVIYIPTSYRGLPVTGIDPHAFSGCTNLTKVVISNNVWFIGKAFDGCTGLTSVVLSEGVSYIAGYAFENCTALTSIAFPSSLKFIDIGVFSGCTKLNDVSYRGTIAAWKNVDKRFWDTGMGEFDLVCVDGIVPRSER